MCLRLLLLSTFLRMCSFTPSPSLLSLIGFFSCRKTFAQQFLHRLAQVQSRVFPTALPDPFGQSSLVMQLEADRELTFCTGTAEQCRTIGCTLAHFGFVCIFRFSIGNPRNVAVILASFLVSRSDDFYCSL